MKWLNFFKNILPGTDDKKVYDFEDMDINEREQFLEDKKIRGNLENNIALIKKIFGNSLDLNIRRFEAGEKQKQCALVYMAGLTESIEIEQILDTIQIELLKVKKSTDNSHKLFAIIKKQVLNNKALTETNSFSKVFSNLTLGSTALLIDGVDKVIICETKGFQIRNVSEPDNEVAIRGPRDGFVENLYTNTSLIRQRIRVPHLWFHSVEIGSLSKTKIALAYVKGLASEELVDEVKSRLEKIDIDNVLESGYIQEYLHDEWFPIFPMIDRTERPDKAISCLVEGKIVILTENTPFVLILPTSLNMYLQAPDDYYESYLMSSFIRLLRYIAFVLSVLLPGIYISILNFHSDFLPLSLLLRISATREGVPFPVIVESLVMESIFEVLREAGLRLPRAVGSAVSIVGALVLGEAAIQAGLVSPPMVIIVAITAISSFTTPSYSLALSARLLRYIFIFLGASMGLFGIQFGIIVLVVYLSGLRSFGQPYFQPFAPFIWQDIKDSLIRLPWWGLITRPKIIGGREPQRQKKGQKPEPPDQEKGD